MRVLKPLDRANQIDLNIIGQTGTDTVRIEFMGTQPFWLDKYLVGILIRKSNNLVINLRTITRPYAFYFSGIQGRTVQSATNNIVGLCTRVSDMT